MEPVEINAGEYYLRAFRNDDRVNDVPALVETYADEETRRYMHRLTMEDVTAAELFIVLMNNGWPKDYRWSWAVCDAVTADVAAGIVLHSIDRKFGSAEVTCWAHPAHRGKGVVPTALNAVLGWAFGAADMHRIVYKHSVSNLASQRVAEKCGFTLEGRLRDESIVDDQRVDELLWSRLATDPYPEQLR
ncbi:RimJ/RimL family protein N-acetyltransferase [Lentzea atacamensis]|uniref:RimJ/RimL family protein N-acetyltransferase n=2 Tax=Lentzea TaxID=165301 RepID=A0A316HUH0_9PSEU|nr:GNAT family protein [Lentzea atacamensis]PWK84109.1 RimJ/RimL family protein N-acetyltransferase [Lentzea atacamensis]